MPIVFFQKICFRLHISTLCATCGQICPNHCIPFYIDVSKIPVAALIVMDLSKEGQVDSQQNQELF